MHRAPRPSRRALLTPLCLLALLCTTPSAAQSPPEEASALPDLSGTWAQLQVTTTISELPVVGDVIGKTTSILLLDVTQSGDTLKIKEQMCDIRIDTSAKRVRTIIPRAFQRAASGTVRKATISVNSSGELSFVEHPKVVVLGAKLKNKASDALPDDEDDARLVDLDKDGNPGLTIKVEGIIDGEMYIVQRGKNTMKGKLDPSSEIISGKITWFSEQSVVDATSMFLQSSPKSKPHGGAAKNFFKMKKIDASTTCASLRKSYAKILE